MQSEYQVDDQSFCARRGQLVVNHGKRSRTMIQNFCSSVKRRSCPPVFTPSLVLQCFAER